MKRTPIAHVIFPRPNLLRPVPEFAWEAVRTLLATDDLDVDVIMPVPAISRAQGVLRRWRGARPWPQGLEERLSALEPRPTLVRYLPLPRRSVESATAAIATHLLRRPRAGRPDVLQGSFLDEGGFTAAMAARVLGVPSIVVAHGTDVRAARGRVEGIGRRRRALASLRSATKVLAVASQLAQDLALLGTRADLLPYTAMAARFPVRPAPAEEEILFVGRLSRAKGVDLLLEAFGRMKHREARLRLVGPEAGDLDVRSLAEQLGVLDRTRIEGEVSQEELPAIYGRASCLALPSRSEGLPCVVAEALLVGRPVVATDVGGISELVDDAVGRLVPPEDVPSLASALDAVLEERFSPEGLRCRVLPMTWERVGPRLAEITRSLL